jgi:hypothetical protein
VSFPVHRLQQFDDPRGFRFHLEQQRLRPQPRRIETLLPRVPLTLIGPEALDDRNHENPLVQCLVHGVAVVLARGIHLAGYCPPPALRRLSIWTTKTWACLVMFKFFALRAAARATVARR